MLTRFRIFKIKWNNSTYCVCFLFINRDDRLKVKTNNFVSHYHLKNITNKISKGLKTNLRERKNN